MLSKSWKTIFGWYSLSESFHMEEHGEQQVVYIYFIFDGILIH
jgi:hypothetical protein